MITRKRARQEGKDRQKSLALLSLHLVGDSLKQPLTTVNSIKSQYDLYCWTLFGGNGLRAWK